MACKCLSSLLEWVSSHCPNWEEMCLAAGDGATLVNAVLPAGDIVREMMSEAERTISQQMPAMLAPSAKMSASH